MKALAASPGADGNVDLVDVAAPELRANEVLIDVEAASMNRGEVRQLQNAEAGWRPGWDVAGVVRERAADGSGPRAGARVVGLVRSGAWSAQVAVASNMLASVPEKVSFEAAATLPVAGMTARKAVEMALVD